MLVDHSPAMLSMPRNYQSLGYDSHMCEPNLIDFYKTYRKYMEAIYFPFIGSAFKVETMYIDYEIVCSFYLFRQFEECLPSLFLVIWS